MTLPRPRMADLCELVAHEYEVPVIDIRGPRRHKHLVFPRQDFMRRALDAGFTTTQVGQFLGRDHSTVIYGARAHVGRAGASA